MGSNPIVLATGYGAGWQRAYVSFVDYSRSLIFYAWRREEFLRLQQVQLLQTLSEYSCILFFLDKQELVRIKINIQSKPQPRHRTANNIQYFPHDFKVYQDECYALVRNAIRVSGCELPDWDETLAVEFVFYGRKRNSDIDNHIKGILDILGNKRFGIGLKDCKVISLRAIWIESKEVAFIFINIYNKSSDKIKQEVHI